MAVITLTTDFGNSEYVGAMKGVILSLAPGARVADITHNLQPFNIKQAAYILYSTIGWFPRRSIHVAVVDPGVGTERRALLLEGEGYYLLGPDNGIFSLLGYKRAYQLEAGKDASPTFHGRDVFAPAAARLSLGVEPRELGREVEEIKNIEVFPKRVGGRKIETEALHIDTFGNVITTLVGEDIKVFEGNRFRLRAGEKEVELRCLPAYGYAGEKELLLVLGSSGMVEVAQNRGRASETLNISPGQKLELEALG